jgi:hypothetical protein
MPQLHQAEAQKLDQLVFGSQATAPARRPTAVRVGWSPRGSKWEQSTSEREIMGAKWEQKHDRDSLGARREPAAGCRGRQPASGSVPKE